MKKIILLSLATLLLVSIVAFGATSIPIFTWDASTTAWVEVTNAVIADATGANTWSTGALSTSVLVPGIGRFMVLPATPTWFKLPTITWNLHVSQWIYISMQYLDYDLHVDAPGDYTVDSFTIHVYSNGGVYTYMDTGGYLTTTSGTPLSIPTWLGYKVDSSTAPAIGLPANGANNAFWYDMLWINANVGTPANKLTLYPGGWWEHTFYGWLGFRVDYTVAKGDYMTWLDIYIQSDP